MPGFRKVRRCKLIQLQRVAGSEDQMIEITVRLKEILNVALVREIKRLPFRFSVERRHHLLDPLRVTRRDDRQPALPHHLLRHRQPNPRRPAQHHNPFPGKLPVIANSLLLHHRDLLLMRLTSQPHPIRLFSFNIRPMHNAHILYASGETATARRNRDSSYAPFARAELVRSRSPRPMFRRSSARTRSATPLTTSAPSSAGSTWMRKGRFPKGMSTTLTIAFATSATSASGTAVRANPCMISSSSFAVGPDAYSAARLLSAGFPAFAK